MLHDLLILCSFFSSKGLRVHDTREISPWDILEGVKNNGPLMLSWFGGVRVKRKPLRFEEQRWLLRFHTHQDQFQDMMYHPNYVKLPESIPQEVEDTAKAIEDGQTPMVETGKSLAADGAQSGIVDSKAPSSGGQLQPGANVVSNQPVAARPGVHRAANPAAVQLPNQRLLLRPGPSQMQNPGMPQPRMVHIGNYPAQMTRPQMAYSGEMGSDRKTILNTIRTNALARNYRSPAPLPIYPAGQQGTMQVPGSQMGYSAAALQQRKLQDMNLLMRQHHQRRVMQLRQQQMQQAMQHSQMTAGGPQYSQYHASVQQSMQPMQANPPMPMHQAMRRTPQVFRQAMMPQQGHSNMLVRPTGNPGQQPSMQYPQQHPPGMNAMHRPRMF